MLWTNTNRPVSELDALKYTLGVGVNENLILDQAGNVLDKEGRRIIDHDYKDYRGRTIRPSSKKKTLLKEGRIWECYSKWILTIQISNSEQMFIPSDSPRLGRIPSKTGSGATLLGVQQLLRGRCVLKKPVTELTTELLNIAILKNAHETGFINNITNSKKEEQEQGEIRREYIRRVKQADNKSQCNTCLGFNGNSLPLLECSICDKKYCEDCKSRDDSSCKNCSTHKLDHSVHPWQVRMAHQLDGTPDSKFTLTADGCNVKKLEKLMATQGIPPPALSCNGGNMTMRQGQVQAVRLPVSITSEVICQVFDASIQSGFFKPHFKKKYPYSFRQEVHGGTSDSSHLIYNETLHGADGRGLLYYMYCDEMKAAIEMLIACGATQIKATIICHSDVSFNEKTTLKMDNNKASDTPSHVDSHTNLLDYRVVWGFVLKFFDTK